MRTYLKSFYPALAVGIFFSKSLTLELSLDISNSEQALSCCIFVSYKDVDRVKTAFCIPPTCNGFKEKESRPRTPLTLEDPLDLLETI